MEDKNNLENMGKNNHGVGAVNVYKQKDLTNFFSDSPWMYCAVSQNRYLSAEKRFGVRKYEGLDELAKDIFEIHSPKESLAIINGGIPISSLSNASHLIDYDSKKNKLTLYSLLTEEEIIQLGAYISTKLNVKN
jgi:hypothetical protein